MKVLATWDRPRVSPCIRHGEVLLVVAMWDRPRVSPWILHGEVLLVVAMLWGRPPRVSLSWLLHEVLLVVAAMWDRPRVSPCLLHDSCRTRMQIPQSRGAKYTFIEWRIEVWTHSFALLVVSI